MLKWFKIYGIYNWKGTKKRRQKSASFWIDYHYFLEEEAVGIGITDSCMVHTLTAADGTRARRSFSECHVLWVLGERQQLYFLN